MADNMQVTPGTGATVAADEIGGALYQRVKIAAGADGTAVDVSAASPLPVSGPVTDTQLRASPVPVSGPLTDTELRASAVPVSGTVTASGPLTDTQLRASAVPVSGTVTASGPVTNTELRAAPVTTSDSGPSWTQVFGVSGAVVTSADASTATAVTDAPTSGQKLCIDDIMFSVGSTAMQVDFEIETAGTNFLTFYCAANTSYQFTPRGKLKLPTADKKLMVDTSAAGNISVTVFYHSEA